MPGLISLTLMTFARSAFPSARARPSGNVSARPSRAAPPSKRAFFMDARVYDIPRQGPPRELRRTALTNHLEVRSVSRLGLPASFMGAARAGALPRSKLAGAVPHAG